MKKIVLGISIAVVAFFAGAVNADDRDFKAGLGYYNSRNYTAAAKKFQDYVDKKPDAKAYYLIGYSFYKLGKFSQAEEYFREAYLIDPDFSPEKAGIVDKSS
jgi:TolA-binding protein